MFFEMRRMKEIKKMLISSLFDIIYLDNLGIYFLTKFQHLISFYKYVAFFGGSDPLINKFLLKFIRNCESIHNTILSNLSPLRGV